MTLHVREVPEGSRYELVEAEDVVVSTVWVERRGDVMVLTHTATEPQYRGRGNAGRLVDAVVEDADRKGLRLVARCPFARAHLRTAEGTR